MAVAANALVGLSAGLRSGMERNRQLRLEEEGRATEAEDRQVRLSDAARRRTYEDEDRAYTRTQRQRQDAEYERSVAARDAQEQQATETARQEGLFELSSALLHPGADPDEVMRIFNSSEMGTRELPQGTRFDKATGALVIPGADGAEQAFKVDQLNSTLRQRLGKQAPKDTVFNMGAAGLMVQDAQTGKFSLVPGSRREETGSDADKPPSGYRWKPDGNLEAIPGGPADKPGAGTEQRPITPSEIRLRRSAFRSALDNRSKDQFGRSSLTGDQRQQYGAIADRMIQKYGTATPGEDDLAQIIVTRMSALPTLEQLTTEEVQQLRASGATQRTGWFDGVSDAEATRRVAQETARAKLEMARRQAEAEIEQEVADIATAYYGASGTPTLSMGTASGAQPAAAPGAGAPAAPAPAGRGATARDVLTPDRLKGHPAAVQAVKADPNLLSALTMPASSPDKLVAAKFPDGKVYYLAGDELREFIMPQ